VPVDLLVLTRWSDRGAVGVVAVVDGLVAAHFAGWPVSRWVFVLVFLVALTAGVAVLAVTRPAEQRARQVGTAADTAAPEADTAGWSTWSFPTRAATAERARETRRLRELVCAGGPITPADRAPAGVLAYGQVTAGSRDCIAGAFAGIGCALQPTPIYLARMLLARRRARRTATV